MTLKSQKRIAANILKVGTTRVWFDPNRLSEIKEAITKADVRSLIKDLAIQKKPSNSTSSGRKKKIRVQKTKGRRKGIGSRKGTKNARRPSKRSWMINIRNQRMLLKALKEKELITNATFKDLYKKSKGGFFRSKRHIKLYLKENKLVISKDG